MTGTVGNFLATIALTLTCSAILFITYRHALRPILVKRNIIPLRNLPQALSDTFSSQGRVRLGNGNGPETSSRDLEEGFRDDSDDEETPIGDDRMREPQPGASD